MGYRYMNNKIVTQYGCQFSLFLMLLVLVVVVNPVASQEDVSIKCGKDPSLVVRRICVEKDLRLKPFVLLPHKPNYILASWVDDLETQDEGYDDYETKFQFSFKMPLNRHHADSKWLWFFGYSQLSVWQMLNFDQSAPFRDTNYEPELMLYRLTNTDILGWKIRLINFGLFNHQSNGQVPPYSRSWNRSYIEFLMEQENFYIDFKVWHRWKEKGKNSENDYMGDDNPDIEKYVGHSELRLFYAGKRHNVNVTLRDTTYGEGYGSIQVDWTFPVSDKEGLRFYIQYFEGYGETLID